MPLLPNVGRAGLMNPAMQQANSAAYYQAVRYCHELAPCPLSGDTCLHKSLSSRNGRVLSTSKVLWQTRGC